jgi:hypothetical protein
VRKYLDDDGFTTADNVNMIATRLTRFLNAIGFENPRRMKHVLNKYFVLQVLKSTDDNQFENCQIFGVLRVAII